MWAYIDRRDKYHASSLALIRDHPGPLVVPALVIPEVIHFLGARRPGKGRPGVEPELAFLADLSGGTFKVEPVAEEDWPRISELVKKYKDQPLGTVDASVVATAERLGITEIATVDRKDFSVVRPNHVGHFTLYPL